MLDGDGDGLAQFDCRRSNDASPSAWPVGADTVIVYVGGVVGAGVAHSAAVAAVQLFEHPGAAGWLHHRIRCCAFLLG